MKCIYYAFMFPSAMNVTQRVASIIRESENITS